MEKFMSLKKIYRKIPYRYALLLKKLYHILLKIYFKFYNILKYRSFDMFNDIDIETTTLCNRRCSYCPNSIFDRSIKKNEKTMHTKLFKKIINDLKIIKFTG